MILHGNRTSTTLRTFTSSGRSIFLSQSQQLKQARDKANKVNPNRISGGMIRALSFLLEVGVFLVIPETVIAEVGAGLAFTGINAGIDYGLQGQVNWTNFGINLGISFVPALRIGKRIETARALQAEKDLEELVRISRTEGNISVEVLADVEKRLDEIRQLRELVKQGKITTREYREIVQTTNRNLVLKFANSVERRAFFNLSGKYRAIGMLKRNNRNGLVKFLNFFGSKRGNTLTQLLQLGSATDAGREFVKFGLHWLWYKPFKKLLLRFDNIIGKRLTKAWESIAVKKLKQSIIKNTIPAVASSAFERFRMLSPTIMWIMFAPTNGVYYPPRLIVARPDQLLEFILRLTETGDAYAYYQSHFAYSKNGKDLHSLNWKVGTLLGGVNVTAWRNVLSISRNLTDVIKKIYYKGELPLGEKWRTDFWTTVKRNAPRKAGGIVGHVLLGREGKKFGTAIVKTITNNKGDLTWHRKDGSYNWQLLATSSITSVKTYAIIYSRRRNFNGNMRAFSDRQRANRIASVGRRLVNQAVKLPTNPYAKKKRSRSTGRRRRLF